jgi:SPP1 family predicted phage head-tail adaptor
MANPGKMDRRLQVQVRTYTRDATGGRIETWADSYKVWAELVKSTSKESIASGADRAMGDKVFRIRYRTDIASGTHRILYQLKFYDITGIDEEGRKDRLLVTCRSVQSLII